MGHVHGDRLADLPLPRKLHDEVIAAGRAQPHHVLPDTGWVSCRLAGPQDARGDRALPDPVRALHGESRLRLAPDQGDGMIAGTTYASIIASTPTPAVRMRL